MSALTSPVEDEGDAFEYPSESYSSRLNDVLGESEEEHDRASEGSDDEFVYTGQDASQGGYHERLSEVLGPEAADIEDVEEERQAERHLLRGISASPIPSATSLVVQVQYLDIPHFVQADDFLIERSTSQGSLHTADTPKASACRFPSPDRFEASILRSKGPSRV